MFWGGMLASKVVFSPSSHRLLLPGLILQVKISLALSSFMRTSELLFSFSDMI